MAYDAEKLSKLSALATLAQKLKNDYTTKHETEALSTRVGNLEAAEIPSKVSQLTNDSKYQTDEPVSKTVAAAVANSQHLKKQVVTVLPSASEAKDDVLYLLMNDTTGHYDIYGLVNGSVVQLDDTTVDLTGYVTNTDLSNAVSTINTSIQNVSNSIGTKITEVTATDDEVTEMLNSVFSNK